jgi:hypothetical protein
MAKKAECLKWTELVDEARRQLLVATVAYNAAMKGYTDALSTAAYDRLGGRGAIGRMFHVEWSDGSGDYTLEAILDGYNGTCRLELRGKTKHGKKRNTCDYYDFKNLDELRWVSAIKDVSTDAPRSPAVAEQEARHDA